MKRSELSHQAENLVLIVENEGKLYAQKQAIIKNLRKIAARGQYDATKGAKAWAYWLEAGAKLYAKENREPAGSWSKNFPASVRREAAIYLESYYRRASLDDGGLGIASHDRAKPRKRTARSAEFQDFNRRVRGAAMRLGWSTVNTESVVPMGKNRYSVVVHDRRTKTGKKVVTIHIPNWMISN